MPCGIYLLVSAGAIYLSTLVDVASMKAWLGLFLVAAAIYFIFFSERIPFVSGSSSALTFADLPGFIMKEKPISNEAKIAIKRTALIVFFKILFIIIL